ncbi:polyamine ABC transporter substrate-binding protein [Zavarzinia sp. CC-PAN008]|uniref:ABC transporter substrate-binding protein n=1 Tax=Zavarzinia sp. CC-PAN008 TaxID=3243332 RepID=UPI003F7491E6
MTFTFTRRMLSMSVLAALAAGALGTGFSEAAQAAELRVVSWGGAYQLSQREAFFKPYTAMGTKIIEDEWSGEIAKIRAMVEAGSVTWDLIDSDTSVARQACDEGLVVPIDWSKITTVTKEKMIGAEFFECAVPNITYSTIFAYDSTKLPNGPTSWADFFDLAKFPGKRGMWKTPLANLEFALIADGVAVDKVYEVLSTPEGVDRAFAKLDTIKASVVWWEAGAQPPQLLADGEVIMSTAWNGRIQAAIDKEGKPFKIVWENQQLDFDLWMIPKGTPNAEEAYRFISWASQPEPMAEQTKWIAYGPANPDAAAKIDPKILPTMPTAPENMKTAFIADYDYWGNNGEELRRRFNTWLAQ